MKIKFFLITILLLFNSCSVARNTSDWFSSKLGSKETTESKVRENPLEVDISQAYYTEDILNLKVYVKAREEVPTSQIAIAAIGLREGSVVEQDIKKLSDFYSGTTLKKNQKVALSFQLKDKKLSEYQVKCSWGAEAEQLITQSGGQTFDPGPTTTRAKLDGQVGLQETETISYPIKCPNEPCDVLFTINSKLVNGSTTPVQNIKLALGIYWVDETKKMAPPSGGNELLDGEELIELDSLQLDSGETKPLRISVDRPIPTVPGGGFYPYLRILNYSAK